VGILVALTYYVFEGAVDIAIDFIWEHLFNTDEQRLLIIPIGIILSIAYFASVHYLDPMKENVEEHGMGNAPPPTLLNLIKVLGIGFLALVAGASLGPEAILVPACLIIGAYIGTKFFRGNKPANQLLAAAGFIALFAAFFHSFIVGFLSVYLIAQETKMKITWFIYLIAAIASAASAATLYLINGHGLFPLPPLDWKLSVASVIGLLVLALLSYAAIHLMRFVHDLIKTVIVPTVNARPWWLHAIIASVGLSALYLVGGPLIQFTGNASIQPLIAQSTVLDWIAITGIVVAKIFAISWSKATGYRGGMIFPSLFVLTGLILIVNQFMTFSFVYGIIFGLTGMFVADRKANILMAH